MTVAWLKKHFEYCDGELLVKKQYHGRMRRPGEPAGGHYGHRYKTVKIQYRRFYLHRLIWFYFNGSWPKFIDHIDGDKSNNRIENLRPCSRSQNHAARKQKTSATGFRGVLRRKNKRTADTFYAAITVRGKSKTVGTFKTPRLAALAYNREARRAFGEFACLNKVKGNAE